MDISLWGIIKGQAVVHCYHIIEFERAVEQTFNTITPQMLWHVTTWWHIR
jgi:hypothetical protein